MKKLAKVKREESVQTAVCRYLRYKHREAIFTAEASGIRLTIGQAKKAKAQRSDSKLPDLIVLEPRGGYAGLLLELKASREALYKKDGTHRGGAHLQGQLAMLTRLAEKGYCAKIAGGIDEAMQVIDEYFALPTMQEIKGLHDTGLEEGRF